MDGQRGCFWPAHERAAPRGRSAPGTRRAAAAAATRDPHTPPPKQTPQHPKERSEAERRRKEKERILLERERARRLAREEEQRARRLAVLAAEEAERERVAAEAEANRGVFFRATLQAAPTTAAAAAARGIRRAADKLVLPPSAGAALMAQEAFKNGAMLFEVTAPSGARTHAGVLEFSADVPEGVVLLPEKVQNCLWGPPARRGGGSGGGGGAAEGEQREDGQPQQQERQEQQQESQQQHGDAQQQQQQQRCVGRVDVAYRRLEKGTYVRLQPELRAFHDAVAGDADAMRAALEDALRGVCCLTEGDWVEVPLPDGSAHFLRVLELQPAPAVSVIDTDIACDVGPSIETEGYLRAREEAEAREAERLRRLQRERDAEAARALAAAEAAAEQERAAAAEGAARRLRIRASSAARLPAEPEPGEPHTTCLFRLPDGGRLQRRFAPGDRVAALFDFIDGHGAGGLWPGRYRLVASFPRRVVDPPPLIVAAAAAEAAAAAGAAEGSAAAAAPPEAGGAEAGDDAGQTLAEAGLGAGQQAAFMLEALDGGSGGGGGGAGSGGGAGTT